MPEAQLSVSLVIQMLGPSLLSLPFIIHESGWGSMLIQLAVCWTFILVSFHFVVECAHYTMSKSYGELAERSISKRVATVVSMFTNFYYVGLCGGLIYIVSNALLLFFRAIFDYDADRVAIAAAVSGVCFILCLFKSTAFLKKIFTLSGLFILILLFTILIYFAQSYDSKQLCNRTDVDYGFYHIAAFNGHFGRQFGHFAKYFPTLQCCYCVHEIIPALIQQLPGPPVPKKNYVKTQLQIATSVSSLAYLLVGFLSAIMFGDENQHNLFEAFDPCYTPFVDVLYVCYSVLMVVGVPVTFEPIKLNVVAYFQKDGFLWTAFVSLLLCACSFAVSIIPSILVIYGLFSSLCGFFTTVFMAIMLYYNYPQLRSKYRFMDQLKFVQNEDAVMNIQILNQGRRKAAAGRSNSIAMRGKADSITGSQQPDSMFPNGELERSKLAEEQENFIDDLPYSRKLVAMIVLLSLTVVYIYSFVQFVIDLVIEARKTADD